MKMAFTFVLLALLGLASTVSTEMTTAGTPLVRCPRVLCFAACEFGSLDDENGCPTCNCLSNPCETTDCEEGYECKVKQCYGLPCIPAEAECVSVPEPVCAPQRCRMYCPFGFQKNDDGCEICACNWTPCENVECPEGSECESYQPDCPEGVICDMVTRCVAPSTPAVPQRSGDHAPTTVEPPHMSCPLIACRLACEFGMRYDQNGCAMCDCNLSPCDTMECGEGQVCTVREENCGIGSDEQICRRAHCTLQPLCEQEVSQQRELLGEGPPPMPTPVALRTGRTHSRSHFLGGAHVPTCTEDGQFQPTQCHHVTGDCWCVDDRGIEVPGTRRNLRQPGATELNCPRNHTASLYGRFNLNHDLENIEDHLQNLQELAHDMLSEWMVVGREYIIITEMTPDSENIHVLQIVFVVRTDENAAHDLATSSAHFQQQAFQQNLHMNYQGHNLTPERTSLHVHHQFAPVLPPMGVSPHRTDFYHQHQAALLSCFIGIAFFLVILAALLKLLVTRHKKGRAAITQLQDEEEPQERYKKNLAFSSKLVNIGDEDKKVVLSDAEGMAQDAVA